MWRLDTVRAHQAILAAAVQFTADLWVPPADLLVDAAKIAGRLAAAEQGREAAAVERMRRTVHRVTRVGIASATTSRPVLLVGRDDRVMLPRDFAPDSTLTLPADARVVVMAERPDGPQ